MNSDIKIIKGRLTLLFKRRPKTRYWLMLTNDTYDQTYNLFFNSQRANERLQSVPLHKLAHYDVAGLEKLLKAITKSTTTRYKANDRICRLYWGTVAGKPKADSTKAGAT